MLTAFDERTLRQRAGPQESACSLRFAALCGLRGATVGANDAVSQRWNRTAVTGLERSGVLAGYGLRLRHRIGSPIPRKHLSGDKQAQQRNSNDTVPHPCTHSEFLVVFVVIPVWNRRSARGQSFESCAAFRASGISTTNVRVSRQNCQSTSQLT